MNKNQLLKILSASMSRYEPDLGKRAAFSKYYPLIETMLRVIPDDTDLTGLSSLEDISKKDAFEDFVLDANAVEVETKLKTIYTDIKTFTNMYIAGNSDQIRRTATAQAVYTDWLNKRQRKNHKIVMPIFIALFVIFSVAVVVFSVMDALSVFAPDTDMGKACTIISSAAGALDFVAGLSFFIYERHDDKKKQEMQNKLDKITSGKIVNIGNNVKGDGNNFGIKNDRILSDEEKEETLDDFISLCNVDNDVKGNNNNFGIINKK